MTLTGYYITNRRTTAPIVSGQVLVTGNPNSFFFFDPQARPLTQIYPGIQIGPNNHSAFSPEIGTADNTDVGSTFRADYKVGALGTISSLTAYTHTSTPRRDIFFGAPRDIGVTDNTASVDVNSKNFSQELRLTSPDNQPLTYVAGVIYMNTQLHFPYSRLSIFPVNWDRFFTTRSFGVFARGTYKITPNDSLTVGLRHQYDNLSYRWQFFQLAPTDPKTLTIGSDGYGFFAGEASYKHDFSHNINAYATYSQTETGRAFDMEDNADAAVGPLTPLASAKVQSFEVGVKSQLFDRKLTLNVDLFRTNYQHFQFDSISTGGLNSVPVIKLLSIGKVRSQGIELNTSLRPTSNLRFGLNLAYIDAEIIDYPGATCYTGQTAATGCVNGVQNLNGVSLPYHSKFKYTVTADYTIPLQSVDFNIGGFYRYQSSQHSDVANDPLTALKGYGVANVYVGLSSKNKSWDAQLFVNNLFDTRYYAQLTDVAAFSSPATTAFYDRGSFRYGGIRLNLKY